MTIRRNKKLTCGCCGNWFRTWEGYEDQDQDKGYGICLRCQVEAEKHNEREWVRLEERVRAALNPDNRKKFDGLETSVRRGLILDLIDKGAIGWRFGGAS